MGGGGGLDCHANFIHCCKFEQPYLHFFHSLSCTSQLCNNVIAISKLVS